MDVRGLAAFAVLCVVSATASGQHVYKCVNWHGAVTYQSERCPDGQRIDRTYDANREIEVGGRVVRNYVPTTSSGGGLSPTYGRPMNSDGTVKSDAGCELARAVTSGRNPYRTIESLAGDAALRSKYCNHTRGPTD
ncbi:DUF4124 domain-containing protein [Luteimonas sp. TWI1437]|uniref:DUF4124 domain-containing protein n=1 Tax=unclassified Luteimonas TaxID=2629088 RepID=UPI00320B55E3